MNKIEENVPLEGAGIKQILVKVLTFAVLLTVASAEAQVALPPPQDPQVRTRFKLRSLFVSPSASIGNVGLDTNVFNTVDDPKTDFTLTLSPALNVWARAGRLVMRGRAQADLVYFQKYGTERSVDGGGVVRLEYPLTRLTTPWLEAGGYRARQRAGFEIDLRSRRAINDLRVGVNIKTGPKTTLVLGVTRNHTSWNGDASFLGSNLRELLDRRIETVSLGYRHDLTTLTTLVAEVTGGRTHFDYFQVRNTDMRRVQVGLDLKPLALISGSVRVGYQEFIALHNNFESFKGLSLGADAGYILRGGTQFSIQASRDTDYSFQPEYPYYLRTGVMGSVTQRITGKWDAQGRIGHQVLAYRVAAGSVGLTDGRSDTVRQFGIGIGYRPNRDLRIGLNVDELRRSSPLSYRDYQGLRVGGAVTYAQ